MAVGRNFAHGIAAIILRDGLHPLGVIILKILLAEIAARLLGKRHDLFHQLAAIVAFTVCVRQRLQRFGIVRKVEYLPRLVGRAIRFHKAAPPVFVGCRIVLHGLGNALTVFFPLARHIHGHRITILRITNGRCKQLAQRLCAKAPVQRCPPCRGTGHHGGQPALFGHGIIPKRADGLRIQRHRGHAAGIEPIQLLLFFDPNQRKAIGAKAVSGGLKQWHGRRHSHRCIHGIAPCFHYIQADLRSQRHRCAGHGILCINHIPAGSIAISK